MSTLADISKKRHRLPAYEHLAAWTERNTEYGEQIRNVLEEQGVIAELAASNRVAHWAYGQTEVAKGRTWIRADEMVPLARSWRRLLSP